MGNKAVGSVASGAGPTGTKGSIPVKQTAKFKAKPQSVPVQKKAVQKMAVNAAGTSRYRKITMTAL